MYPRPQAEPQLVSTGHHGSSDQQSWGGGRTGVSESLYCQSAFLPADPGFLKRTRVSLPRPDSSH